MEPTPQPSPRLNAVDVVPSVVIEVLRPSLLILHPQGDLRVLMSRDTQIQQHRIHLYSSRLIRIPIGWRFVLARFLACVVPVRLPDEMEFKVISVERTVSPSPVLTEDKVVGYATFPDDLIHLDDSEYAMLCNARGRQLPRLIHSLWQTGSLRNLTFGRWDSAA